MINMLNKMVARRNFSSVDFATLKTAVAKSREELMTMLYPRAWDKTGGEPSTSCHETPLSRIFRDNLSRIFTRPLKTEKITLEHIERRTN